MENKIFSGILGMLVLGVIFTGTPAAGQQSRDNTQHWMLQPDSELRKGCAADYRPPGGTQAWGAEFQCLLRRQTCVLAQHDLFEGSPGVGDKQWVDRNSSVCAQRDRRFLDPVKDPGHYAHQPPANQDEADTLSCQRRLRYDKNAGRDDKWQIGGDPIGNGDETSARQLCEECKGDIDCIEDKQEDSTGGTGAARKAIDLIAGQAQNLAVYVQQILIDPKNCIACTIVLFVAATLKDLALDGFNYIAFPVLLILMALFAIWVLVQLIPVVGGMSSSQSTGRWGGIILGSFAFVGAVGFLGVYSAGGGSPQDKVNNEVAEEVFTFVVAPALSIGAGIGTEITDQVLTSRHPTLKGWLDEPFPAPDPRAGKSYRELTIEQSYQNLQNYNLLPAATLSSIRNSTTGIGSMTRSLMGLISAVQFVGALGMSRAAGYLGDAQKARGAFAGAFSAFIGVMLGMTFGMFMMYSVLRLVDPLIRLMAVLALSPIMAAAFVFPSTRQVATSGIKTMLYAAAYFAVCGIIYALAVQFLMASFVTDPSKIGSTTLQQFLDELALGTDALDPSGRLDVLKPLSTFLIVSVGIAMLQYVPKLAGMLSGSQDAGSIGDEIRGALQGMARTGMGVAVHGSMTMAGRMASLLKT